MLEYYKIEKLNHLTDAIKNELVEVWEKSVRSSHHFLTDEEVVYYRTRLRQIYLQAVTLYVIRETQRIVAFMGLSDDMVEMLFVLPSAKCKGLGTALLNFAFNEKHICKIDVNEENTEAYSFYIKRGYKVVGRDDFDADGQPHAIVHLMK